MSSPVKNKHIAFLVPYPGGTAPGQRFRFEQYLSRLEEKNFSFRIFPFLDNKVNDVLYRKGFFFRKTFGVLFGYFRRMVLIPKFLSADTIFIFRECAPLGPPLLEWLLAVLFRKKIVYDFDDAIWLGNTSEENRIIASFKWHSKVRAICRWSSVISCGNSYLAAFAKNYNSNVVINPTTIDTDHLHNPELFSVENDPSSMIIGWTGTHSTLRYLEPLLPVIESLLKKYPQLQLMVIADRPPAWKYPFLKFVPWTLASEISDLMKIDIGIMPLSDDEWSKGKCGFKALQYMALEKPAVVSRVGVNSEIVDHGVNGFICNTAEEWTAQLEYLLTHRDERLVMGKRGRMKVIRRYSVSSNASNFLSLFE